MPMSFPSSGASLAVKVSNPRGLRDFAARLPTASYQPVDIIALGHSFVWGVGVNGYPTPAPDLDTVASRVDGWIPELRDSLNLHVGMVSGGEWIHALEGRCTRAGGTALTGFGVLCGNTSADMYGISTSSAQIVTFPIVVGAGGTWAIDLVHWEDATANYVGAAEISLDGVSWTPIDRVSSASSSVHQYRTAVLSNIAAGSYNCQVRYLNTYAGKSFGLIGMKVYNAAGGVNIMRNGTGATGSGAGSDDWIMASGSGTQQGRVRPATYQSRPADLFIIQGPHNDCTKQTGGLTPAQSVTNMRVIIDAILTNGKTWAATRKTSILLVCDPYPDNVTSLNIPAGGTYSRADYWAAWETLTAIYPDNVALMKMADVVGTYAQANAASLYYDGIHWNRKGHRVQGRAVALALMSAGLNALA